MLDFLNNLNSIIWGLPLLSLLLFTAMRFTFKSRFFQFRGFFLMMKSTIGSIFNKKNSPGDVSQFAAFCSVLGACIGTGNIVGVATAIHSGGPGTVFWMWISAIFSMMTAYSENYLGIHYKRRNRYGETVGGAFSYIENGLKMKGLAKCYALFCVLSACGMGNLTQSNSISESLNYSLGIPPVIIGIITATGCFFILRGGIKRITDFGKLAVPFMSLIYIILSALVLYKFKSNILPACTIILKEAFSINALKGYGIYKAARYGFSRGVFSNEAGLGSSTIMHSQVENCSGENQGMWAMLEVFIDTVVLCTVTALVILVTNSNYQTLFGAGLSVTAYGTIGTIGKTGISVLTAIFAFTSLAGCSVYAQKSADYLLGKKRAAVFRYIYPLLSFAGCVSVPKALWAFADICNGLMAVPNLFALNSLKKEIVFPSKKIT